MTDTQMFDPSKIILNKTKEKNDFYKILYNNKRLSLELEDIIIVMVKLLIFLTLQDNYQ